MAQEVERKFLVAGDFKPFAKKATRITQGYLSSVPERTVRVRVKGEKGFITIKGIGSASGASRFEWEKEIPVSEVQDLLQICEPGVIDKTRYLVEAGDHTYEVDEFYGDNEGPTPSPVPHSRLPNLTLPHPHPHPHPGHRGGPGEGWLSQPRF